MREKVFKELVKFQKIGEIGWVKNCSKIYENGWRKICEKKSSKKCENGEKIRQKNLPKNVKIDGEKNCEKKS